MRLAAAESAEREDVRYDKTLFYRIVRGMEEKGLTFSADDVVEAFVRYKRDFSVFSFMEAEAKRLRENGNVRTAETYAAALNSFRRSRKDADIIRVFL